MADPTAFERVQLRRLLNKETDDLTGVETLTIIGHAKHASYDSILEIVLQHGPLDRHALFVELLVGRYQETSLMWRYAERLAGQLGEDAFADLVARLVPKLSDEATTNQLVLALRGAPKFNAIVRASTRVPRYEKANRPWLGFELVEHRREDAVCLAELGAVAARSPEHAFYVWLTARATEDADVIAAVSPIVLREVRFAPPQEQQFWQHALQRDLAQWLDSRGAGGHADFRALAEAAIERGEATWADVAFWARSVSG